MKILVSGGGTGGHIYPALSLIQAIQEKDEDHEVLYIGTDKGLESRIIPEANIPFKTIQIQGLSRSLSFHNIKTAWLFLQSLREVKKIIKAFQPDIVLGTGGYVCAPVVYQAARLNIPTMIHEQNSVPGLTNKFLAKYVDAICTCFSQTQDYFPKNKVHLTGNPRAQEVVHIEKSDILKEFDLDPKKPTVLIFGGSRGALTLQKAFLESYEVLANKPYQILYSSGTIYYEDIPESLKNHKIKNIVVRPYIRQMEQVLPNIDLVVSRAGATSIAEFTALGLPTILIPSPNVTNDHQTKNAQALLEFGATQLLTDQTFDGKELVNAIDQLMLDDHAREDMSLAARQLGFPNASDTIIQLMEQLTSSEGVTLRS